MPLYITEYSYLAKDSNGGRSDLPAEPGTNSTALAITTAAQAVTMRAETRFIRMSAHTATIFAIGPAANSSVRGALLAANQVGELFATDGQANTLVSFKMFV